MKSQRYALRRILSTIYAEYGPYWIEDTMTGNLLLSFHTKRAASLKLRYLNRTAS